MPDRPDLGYTPTLGTVTRLAAERWGERDLLVMPEGRMTFAEVEARSRQLGKRMLGAGLGKGSRIGLLYTYSQEFLVTWLAAARIGAVAMPFSTLYRPAELETVLRLGDVHTLLAPPTLLGRDVLAYLEEAVPGLADRDAPDHLLQALPYLRQVWITGRHDRPWAVSVSLDADADLDREVSDSLFAAVEAEVTPADLAQVTYTSGSSALPKGVVHSHGAIVRTTGPVPGSPLTEMFMRLSDVESENKILNGFPFFWIGGTLLIGIALQSGKTLCCIERFEPGAALDFIESERIGSFIGWPSLNQSLRAHPTFAQRDLSCCPALLVSPTEQALANSKVEGIPGHRGMSETVGNWNGVDRKVIDPDTGATLAEGAEGELCVRGHGALQGYLKKEREDTFDDDGWLHTGDRCIIIDNTVYFIGRFTEMIKTQGANVSPREVEMALEAFDEVEHALVFGLPHPSREEEVVAAIVPRPGADFDVDDVLGRLSQRVSSFKVPTRVHVLADSDQVPWLASGKPDKLQLKAMVERGEVG